MVDALADQGVDDLLVAAQQGAVGAVHEGLVQTGQLGPQAEVGNTTQPIKFNLMCTALNHHYSLTGLNRQHIDDPDPSPQKDQEKTPLISNEETLGRNTEWRIPLYRDGQECNGCHELHP